MNSYFNKSSSSSVTSSALPTCSLFACKGHCYGPCTGSCMSSCGGCSYTDRGYTTTQSNDISTK